MTELQVYDELNRDFFFDTKEVDTYFRNLGKERIGKKEPVVLTKEEISRLSLVLYLLPLEARLVMTFFLRFKEPFQYIEKEHGIRYAKGKYFWARNMLARAAGLQENQKISKYSLRAIVVQMQRDNDAGRFEKWERDYLEKSPLS